MLNPIKTLEANTKGRDFIIGDLHGSYDALIRLLDGVEFDGDKDRLISVGDLVDRGPDSLLCLQLLREPWFHAVLGNHEWLTRKAFTRGDDVAFWTHIWLRNGGIWGLEFLNDFIRECERLKVPYADQDCKLPQATKDFMELLKLIDELPYLITIKTPSGGRVHVLHAELPPKALNSAAGLITDEDLEDPEIVRELATRQADDGDVFLWGRYKYRHFSKEDLSDHHKVIRTAAYHLGKEPTPKLSHIFSGHTIVQRPLTIENQTCLDTGAFEIYPGDGKIPKWAGLTAVELGTGKFYRATLDEFKEVDRVIVNTWDIKEV